MQSILASSGVRFLDWPFDAKTRDAAESEPPRAPRITPAHVLKIEQEVVYLYIEYSARLLRYTTRLAPDITLAQDAVQEAFLRYYVGRLNETVYPTTGKTWIFRVARNYILDCCKSSDMRNQTEYTETLHCQDSRYDPEVHCYMQEVLGLAAVALSSREMECLSLRSEGMTYREIGEILGLKVGTVGATLNHGLEKLRDVMKPARVGR